MEIDLLNKFDVLDINNKRNRISDELILMHELIKKYENTYGITPITSVKNYDPVIHKNLREAEMLTFLYEDIYNVQQELISLLSYIDNNKK